MRRGVEITIVFRYFTSSEDAQKRSPFIDDTFELNNLRIISCPDLHAKIYVNEVRAILTSRNLYERKEGSSIEVGVRYNKVSDSKMYNDLLMLAREIFLPSDSFIALTFLYFLPWGETSDSLYFPSFFVPDM